MRRAVGNLGERNIPRHVDEELAFHIEMRTQQLITRGLPPDAARAEALRQFGDLTAVRQDCIANDEERVRASRRAGAMDELKQNLVYATRTLRRNAGFATGIVLTLALGIGANVAIFTLVHAVLLRPLPVADPESLVAIGNPSWVGAVSHSTNVRTEVFNWEHYKTLRQRLPAFSGVLASGRADGIELRADASAAEPDRPRSRFVSGNYFQVLGVNAARGRAFTESDDAAVGASPVAVISHALWQRRFNGDAAVVGRDVVINSLRFTIVGVMPEQFRGEIVGQNLDLWLPLTMQPVIHPRRPWLTESEAYWLLLLGRTKSGVSFEQARSQTETAVRQIVVDRWTEGAPPPLNEIDVFVSDGARGFSAVRKAYGTALTTLMVGVGVLLLIICANVANLLLARAVARGREMSLRLAIGASRGRLVRQLLSESMMLALGGAALGLLVARWGSRLLLALHADGANVIPLDTALVLPVLGFTAGLAVLTVLIFGLLPALRTSRVDLATALRAGSRATIGPGSAAAGTRHTLGPSLIAAQVALSLVLLIGAALLVRSLQSMHNQDLGLERDHLIIADVDATTRGYAGERLAVMMKELATRLQQIGGVAAVTYSMNGIFSGTESSTTFQVPGFIAKTDDDTLAAFDRIGPGYVTAIGGRLLRGRDITQDDLDRHVPVALVNQTMARFYFGDADPLGRIIQLDDSSSVQIVGVIADVKDHDLKGEVGRRFYRPIVGDRGGDPSSLSFEVRTTGDPGPIVEKVRKAIVEFDAQLPIERVSTLSQMMRQSVREDRLLARLASGFGVLALLLAAIGLYGVMTYAVSRRTGEIGLRLALGAQRTSVIRMVLGDSLKIVLIGVLVGVPLAIGASRLLRHQLYGISSTNPSAFAVALAVLMVSAVAAALVPAWRASRVEPLLALRQD
jgi:predicted permease